MALQIETPEPPDLSNRGVSAEFDAVETAGSAADLRRSELEEVLREGAWQEAFEEWTAYTDLSPEEYRLVEDADLIREFDVYWDPEERRLRYVAPRLSEDAVPDASDAGTASKVNAELDDLGRTLVRMLADEYVTWSEEGRPGYLWDEESFGQETGEETFDLEVETFDSEIEEEPRDVRGESTAGAG